MVDESHVTIPQVRGMYFGDRRRKETLVDHGFRLPSALDNRPLKFEEFEELVPQVVYVSATPGPYELEQCEGQVVEQPRVCAVMILIGGLTMELLCCTCPAVMTAHWLTCCPAFREWVR